MTLHSLHNFHGTCVGCIVKLSSCLTVRHHIWVLALLHILCMIYKEPGQERRGAAQARPSKPVPAKPRSTSAGALGPTREAKSSLSTVPVSTTRSSSPLMTPCSAATAHFISIGTDALHQRHTDVAGILTYACCVEMQCPSRVCVLSVCVCMHACQHEHELQRWSDPYGTWSICLSQPSEASASGLQSRVRMHRLVSLPSRPLIQQLTPEAQVVALKLLPAGLPLGVHARILGMHIQRLRHRQLDMPQRGEGRCGDGCPAFARSLRLAFTCFACQLGFQARRCCFQYAGTA